MSDILNKEERFEKVKKNVIADCKELRTAMKDLKDAKEKTEKCFYKENGVSYKVVQLMIQNHCWDIEERISTQIYSTKWDISNDKAKELTDIVTEYFPMVCPKEGGFYGYKKAVTSRTNKEVIVELYIPDYAKRSSAFGRKCRCSEALVKKITFKNNPRKLYTGSAKSNYTRDHLCSAVSYKTGCIVRPDYFDDYRFEECSHGIHFFMTYEEAVNYKLN